VQRLAKPERSHVVPARRHRRMLEVHGEVTAGPEAVRYTTHVSHTAQGGQGEIPATRNQIIIRSLLILYLRSSHSIIHGTEQQY